MTKRFDGKLAVVTGASRGIGYQVAKGLAKEGAHVIAIARTVGGLEDLDDEIQAMGGSMTLVPLDLMDFDAIDRLGASIYERWGKLDMMVGNAGLLGILSPIGHIDPKDFEEVMAVNVTANYRLLRSLDPLLRTADAGRAVFVSSGAAHKCKPYWGIYSVSKAALETLVRTYAGETATTGDVRANLINPGPMRTAMRAKAMPGEYPEVLPHPSELVAPILDMLEPGFDETGKLYDFPTRELRSFPAA
ncbi:SDR family NAD(P)-dependent oxidoreductase [Breoghania sp.]|uniref:SDR family NAD(P)-dependent oxidoreductase n=1 Tax=Breoghania sp. TaxID=2065378 RepID=UPI002629247F|nr:SDR family NAD(P)-dependent oxidoreductase [Breoghania sp.]MDJ0930851.1 SDR family NAD(P)-dependent oxidoreductase [Breoghania sp.]